MIITTKQFKHYPFHFISTLEVDGKQFCYILEDTLRPAGIKVDGFTALPRTGKDRYYLLGIRYSPAFKRECLVIYNQKDKETVVLDGISFKYAMFHGGNTHLNTDGCPLTAYNVTALENVFCSYRGRSFQFQDQIVQGTAEKDLFELVAPLIRSGEEVRLYML